MSNSIIVHFDGACEPVNPGGIATYGWTIHFNGKHVSSGYDEVCRGPSATNNIAEWSALESALKEIARVKKGAGCILEIRGDSQLVINQISGKWKCNKTELQEIKARCLELLASIAPASWEAVWIPREMNAEADRLSKLAYKVAALKK